MQVAPGARSSAPTFAIVCGLTAALVLSVVAHTAGLGEAETVRLDAADRLLGAPDVLAPPGRFGNAADLPVPALLAAGAALLPVPDPLGARLPSILALSLALGLLALSFARLEDGRLAAGSALACLLASPPALGLAVLVGPDPLLAALGLLAVLACAAPAGPLPERLAGAAVALAPLVHGEGLLVAPPLLLVAAARRRWDLLRALVVGAGAGALLWGLLAGHAASGQFLEPPPELHVFFLGERYQGPAPAWRWLPTLLVAMTPPGVLAALALGLAGAVRRARRGCDLTGWLLAATAAWAAATLLPRGPRGGDLLGQLPLLVVLSATAGLGLAHLLAGRGRALAWVALLLPATGLAAVLEAHPRQRCWRSPLVGGPAGAERLGLEPAPDLSVAARDVRLWLGAALPPGSSLSTTGSAWAATHVRRRLLRPDLRASGRGDFIVVANRPSRVAAEALALVEQQVVHRVQAGPTTLLVVVQRGGP